MIESVYINVIHSVHLNTVKVSNLYKVDKKNNTFVYQKV